MIKIMTMIRIECVCLVCIYLVCIRKTTCYDAGQV